MAVEIREVIIRAVLSQDNEWSKKDKAANARETDKEAIVQACVQEVMRMIRRSKER